ncbi:MAG: hypothetical protein DMF64_10025 [Acidobacteria bacterium]|nr:MAG: hypothetical protein DMF64_10025 [Acidobacteriota bacterium]
MKDTERHAYEMLVRVRDFGQARAADFPAATTGGGLFAALDTIVQELDGHAEAQTSNRSAAVQGTTGRAVARAALREDLEAINRTARAMAINNPGLADRFRLPRGNNDQTLLSTARAFASDAVPFKAEFIRHEMPAAFLDDLAADIADLEQAIADQNRSGDAHIAATQSIDTTLEHGLNLKRQLDAVVRNKYRADSATLAAWTSATHVESKAKAKKAQPKPTAESQK